MVAVASLLGCTVTPPAPAPTVAPAPPAQGPPSHAAWAPPPECRGDPARTKPLLAVYQALPPLAKIERPAPPPITARGAPNPVVDLGKIDIGLHHRPHHGHYTDSPPPLDDAADWGCSFALALDALSAPRRAELRTLLGDRAPLLRIDSQKRPSEQVRALDDRATALALLLGGEAAPEARFIAALLLRSRLGSVSEVAGAPGELELLRGAVAAWPPSHPLGARARLELADAALGPQADEGKRAFDEVVQAPVGWANAAALIRIGWMTFTGPAGGDPSGIPSSAVAASIARDARTKNAALALAVRLAWEDARYDDALAYADAAFTDPGIVALPEDDTASTVGLVSLSLDDLPDAALDRVAAWPKAISARVAQAAGRSRPRSRFTRLRALGGSPGESREAEYAPAKATENDVDTLVRGCAFDTNVGEARFSLRVTTFASGPPEVTLGGAVAPRFAGCLRERAAYHIADSPVGVRARVVVGPLMAPGG